MLSAVAANTPAAARSAWSLWFEVLIVLVLTQPLSYCYSPALLAIGSLWIHDTAPAFYAPSILYYALTIALTLAIIRVSGDPWSTFGISKPMPVDVVSGGIICVLCIAVTSMGVEIFIDVLKSILSSRDFYQITHVPRSSYDAHGWAGFFALLVLASSVGFSEELITRGYLIPRLERLLKSTWASVIASAGFFGVTHWHQGILSMFNAFLFGIVTGIAFAWSRRIWPVAIAHAGFDFSLFLSRAR